MRRLHEEIREIRVPSEVLARWALETPVAAQEATGAALAFLVHAEHAATTLLPVPTLLRSEQAILDPDGFLRQPRGAVEHFRLRADRAIAWMDLFIFFRERFPAPAQRQPPDAPGHDCDPCPARVKAAARRAGAGWLEDRSDARRSRIRPQDGGGVVRAAWGASLAIHPAAAGRLRRRRRLASITLKRLAQRPRAA